VGTIISVRMHRQGLRSPGGALRVVNFRRCSSGISRQRDEEIRHVLLGAYQDLHAGDEVERTAASWTWQWVMNYWGVSSIRSAGRFDGKGPVASNSGCPSNVRLRPSWIARRSRSRSDGPDGH